MVVLTVAEITVAMFTVAVLIVVALPWTVLSVVVITVAVLTVAVPTKKAYDVSCSGRGMRAGGPYAILAPSSYQVALK